MSLRPPRSSRSLSPCHYTTLFRSQCPHAARLPEGARLSRRRCGEDRFRAAARLPVRISGGVDLPSLQEAGGAAQSRSEEHPSELQSLMRISSAVFSLNKKIS